MAATKSPLNVILGGAAIGTKGADPLARFETPEEINNILAIFANHGYDTIDSSRMYGASESRLGGVAAGDKFTIDTKVMSWQPGIHSKDNVLKEIDTSLEALKVKQIHLEYLHVPDRDTPFEEPCEAMNIAHKASKIKGWGLSNYTADEVEEICQICEQNGWVKPSVYQGHYNAIVRGGEKTLFPVLRKHGMKFYAYSPAGGGFFAGNHKKPAAGGRFDPSHVIGQTYGVIYDKPAINAAVEKALEVIAKHGIGGHAAALRWTVYHGILKSEFDDAVVLGVSTSEQLESNLDVIEEGPLPAEAVTALEKLYEGLGEDELSYHL